MRTRKHFAALATLALLCLPAALFGQEQSATEHGSVDFGVRYATGEVSLHALLDELHAKGLRNRRGNTLSLTQFADAQPA